MTRWKDRDGQPTIVEASHLSNIARVEEVEPGETDAQDDGAHDPLKAAIRRRYGTPDVVEVPGTSGRGCALRKSNAAPGNAPEMFGAWPPSGIVHSSTAPPGRQPDHRVTAASSGAPPLARSASTSTRSLGVSGVVEQPSYVAQVRAVPSAPGYDAIGLPPVPSIVPPS